MMIYLNDGISLEMIYLNDDILILVMAYLNDGISFNYDISEW